MTNRDVISQPLLPPTMTGCKDPKVRVAKLRERQQDLRHEIAIREDQIGIMEHEISGLLRGEGHHEFLGLPVLQHDQPGEHGNMPEMRERPS